VKAVPQHAAELGRIVYETFKDLRDAISECSLHIGAVSSTIDDCAGILVRDKGRASGERACEHRTG